MCGGDRLQHPYMYVIYVYTYVMLTQQCHSCNSVPHNMKTIELSMQLTSTTGSGSDSSAVPAEYSWMLPG